MAGRSWNHPVLTRGAGLIAVISAIGYIGFRVGVPVNWATAIVYGVALGFAVQWPIVLPRTGAYVVLLNGLVFEALWRTGLPTALVIMLLEFVLRLATTRKEGLLFPWWRPILTTGSLLGAYIATYLTTGLPAGAFYRWIPRLDVPAFVMVYSFWSLMYFVWAFLRSRYRQQEPLELFVGVLRQTWWLPLIYLLVPWPLAVVHQLQYPLEVVVCLLLLWVQFRAGTVFTTLFQDRIISQMVFHSVALPQEERFTSLQVLRMAHAIAKAANLTRDEIRLIGYAAMLQHHRPEPTPAIPLWLAEPPTAACMAQIRETVLADERRTLVDGAIADIAPILRFRYANYDGTGWPNAAGERIPVGAQVLAAANAIISTTQAEEEKGGSVTNAVAWIREHARSRFSPRILDAVQRALPGQQAVSDMTVTMPETIRQLQGLVVPADWPSTFQVGLRRILLSVRAEVGLAPDLPEEVQAVGRIAAMFAASTDGDQVARTVVEAVGRLMGAKVALALAEGDDSGLFMRWRATHGFTQIALTKHVFTVRGGDMGRAILDQTPVQVADLREVNGSVAAEIARAESIRSTLFIPLVGRGRTIGMLVVGTQGHHWFSPREVGLIRLMADHAATSLENARLIQEAAEQLDRLTRLNAFADTLLDNLQAGIIAVDMEGRVILQNAAFRSQFGLHISLAAGQGLPDHARQAFQLDQVLLGQPVPERDVQWGIMTVELQAIPLRDRYGVLLGAICMMRDVTRVRMMEQQVRRVEKLAAVGELAAGAAHEIRNPLTAIRGFIQLLQVRATDPETDGDLYQITLNEIDRIDGIIRDMLLLARPTELERIETSIPLLVEEILRLHGSRLDRQQIAVVQEYDPAVDLVPTDPKMFRQLLLNLVINAVQAMPDGGVLRISLAPAGPGRVALKVEDSGVGISPENMKRLFVPFFTTKEEGTGLGLALCYSVVQAHHGRIDVESTEGVGTTFTVTLPSM